MQHRQTPGHCIGQISTRVATRFGTFAAERRPNLYQKARFGNRIKWALKEAGYAPHAVELMTHELVTKMALATRGRPPG